MADFVAEPVLMRHLPDGQEVVQAGGYARVGAQVACSVITLAEIDANPRHHLHRLLPALRERNAVAIVLAEIGGKPAQIVLTAEQFALGAAERERYAGWLRGVAGRENARQAEERAWDRGQNEGGEGYNPHRRGASHTYRGRA